MAGTYLKLADNAETTLNGALTDSATEIVVTSVATLPSTYPYILTIWDCATYTDPGDDSSMEKVLVTSGVTTTLTVTRGYDGTSGVAHTSGETIALLSTSAIIDDSTYGVETVLDTHIDSSGTSHTYIDQDVTSGSSPAIVGTNVTAIPTENILMCEIGSATYDSLHDLINNTQSSGIVSGFELSNSRTALELDMAAGKGYIKTSDSAIGETCAFDISPATENITLSSGINYLYIDYNSGSPQVVATTDRTTIELNQQFTLGRVFKDASNGLHILNSGTKVSNLARTEHERLIDIYGFQHVEGAVPSEVGTLNLDVTAGVWYTGHNKITTDWINTDTEGDTFVYQHYGTASWIVDNATATDIDCTHYNDGDDVLGNLTSNAYGVQWVYIAHDSHVNIIYDTINGALAVAQAAQPPTSLPPEVAAISDLIGKIIVRQTGVIISIESTHGVSFTSTGIIEHNDTGGLNDGDYKHLTAAEKTLFDTVETNAAADQTASEVPIVDVLEYYIATDVEGALAESKPIVDTVAAKWQSTEPVAVAAKTTPVDADSFLISDSEAGGVLKMVSGTDLKAYLKTYFDTLYAAI